MISKLQFSFLCLAIVLAVIVRAQEWDYTDPNAWNSDVNFPDCAGSSQSPINIVTSTARFNSTLRPIVFNNYGLTYLFNFTNSASSKTIVSNQYRDTISGLVPYITGSNFGSDRFNLLQFHYHWGSDARSGSEHTLDGRSFAGELHLVHQSPTSGRYAVVGFFLSVNITSNNNTRLGNLLRVVDANAEADTISSLYLTLTNIMSDPNPANLGRYYRYSGSLTTPPCTEGIIWNVYQKPIQISVRQMSAFYSNSVDYNFRPVQPLNGRSVQRSS